MASSDKPFPLPADDPDQDAAHAPSRPAFLSGPPRSGELSPFAQKVATQAFVWLCSVIVFAATADFSRATNTCSSLCGYAIAAGVVSFLFSSLILVAHYLCWAGRIDRNGWFTSAAEMRFMVALVIWWGPAVGGLSSLQRGPEAAPAAAAAAVVGAGDANNATAIAEAVVAALAADRATGNTVVYALAPHTNGVAIFFGWLAFFASIYGAYKAYHTKKEEQSYMHLHQQMSIEAENEEEHYANFS
jgi:hypothetical protein